MGDNLVKMWDMRMDLKIATAKRSICSGAWCLDFDGETLMVGSERKVYGKRHCNLAWKGIEGSLTRTLCFPQVWDVRNPSVVLRKHSCHEHSHINMVPISSIKTDSCFMNPI